MFQSTEPSVCWISHVSNFLSLFLSKYSLHTYIFKTIYFSLITIEIHDLFIIKVLTLNYITILFQTLEMMIVSYLGYSLPYKGSLWTMGSLLFLQGLGGMCYGFLLSVLCSSYTLSFFIATGSFYPMILLCGMYFFYIIINLHGR